MSSHFSYLVGIYNGQSKLCLLYALNGFRIRNNYIGMFINLLFNVHYTLYSTSFSSILVTMIMIIRVRNDAKGALLETITHGCFWCLAKCMLLRVGHVNTNLYL